MTKQQLGYYRPYLNNQDRKDNGARFKQMEQDTHHIIPKSMWGSNDKSNLITIRQDLHRALHCVFGNGWPKEQLEQLLNINERVIAQDTKNAIIDLLDKQDAERYKQWSLFIRKK